METYTTARIGNEAIVPITKPRYCLYARKSTEQDEKQALSIDSQIKEMLQIAEREGLEIIDIRREAHSAKDSGQQNCSKSFSVLVLRSSSTHITIFVIPRGQVRSKAKSHNQSKGTSEYL